MRGYFENMHARHRNGPGNGYWSDAMGMRGQASASRISPEGSMRGHRNYSDYRNNRRGGFGRGGGHSRQFQPAMPPSRGTDIFMEAGRLAAEYLVSKGILPPDALAGKWKNDGLKNQMGGFQGFRTHDLNNSQVPMDGHVSAHARLGNTSVDVGPVRRRYSHDNNSLGSRNSVRESRRAGSFKNYGSEVKGELGKSESWGERSMAPAGTEADNDDSSEHRDEQPHGKDAADGDGGTQTLSPGELAQEGDAAAHPESELDTHRSVEATGAKESYINEKCLPSDAKEEPAIESDGANKSNAESEVANEGKNDAALYQKQDENVEVKTVARENALVGKDIVDLVKDCKFAQVPTKPRSSLTMKGSKGDPAPMNKDRNITEKGLSIASIVHVIDSPDESSAGGASSHQMHKPNSLDSDVVKTPADKEPEMTYMTRPGQCSQFKSFPEKSLCKEEGEDDEGLSAFGRSNSMFIDRGGKRAMDDDAHGREGFKKHREWAPMDAESDGCMPLSSSMEIQPSPEGARTSQCMHSAPTPDRKSLNISLFPKTHDELCEFMEEKPLFPGSFKTCDLNLIGTSDTHENRDGEQVFMFPSIIQTGKETAPIDVGLSMSNGCNVPNKNAKLGVNNNDIEVIDLENDSAQEDQSFSYPERRPDSLFTELDGFPNNVNNVNEISDIQDGYGLMFSELLGNDSPNCSSVPTDLNSLHNTMGLPHAEGILGDDDSIYMSLGEIPISFLRTWEQPTQNYGKPF